MVRGAYLREDPCPFPTQEGSVRLLQEETQRLHAELWELLSYSGVIANEAGSAELAKRLWPGREEYRGVATSDCHCPSWFTNQSLSLSLGEPVSWHWLHQPLPFSQGW